MHERDPHEPRIERLEMFRLDVRGPCVVIELGQVVGVGLHQASMLFSKCPGRRESLECLRMLIGQIPKELLQLGLCFRRSRLSPQVGLGDAVLL